MHFKITVWFKIKIYTINNLKVEYVRKCICRYKMSLYAVCILDLDFKFRFHKLSMSSSNILLKLGLFKCLATYTVSEKSKLHFVEKKLSEGSEIQSKL